MTTTAHSVTDDRSLSLTERKRGVIRDVIVDAMIEAIRERGIDFSVQDVADRAGVTHRTVYRYFKSRQALVDAAAERYERWLAEQGIGPVDTFEELIPEVESLFRLFERQPDLIRAVSLYTLVTGERTAPSKRRTENWRQLFSASFAHLPPTEIEPVFAVARTLTGTLGWYLLTSQFELTGEQAAAAVRATLEPVLANLRQREEEAARAELGREP